MIIVSSTGIATNSAWWRTMAVDEGCLVFESAGDDPRGVLILASLASEDQARALLAELMDRMRYGGRRFDFRAVHHGPNRLKERGQENC
jgi:hypothetical protein